MPWEKSFDSDEILDRAAKVFWAKGYEGASMAELIEATGINKGSVYNAFGTKKNLFTQALLKYDRDQRRAALIELTAMNAPVAAIQALFEGLVAQSLADTERKGCFLVNTALDLPNHDQDTEETVKAALSEFEQFFERQIELGHKTGAIPESVDPKLTAKVLLSLVVGLRVLARGVYDEDSLKALSDQALTLIR